MLNKKQTERNMTGNCFFELYGLINKCSKRLARLVRNADPTHPASDCEEQLYSEYYLVAEAALECKRELKSLKRQRRIVRKASDGMPLVFNLIRKLLLEKAELSTQSIARLLKKYNPSFDEISLTPLFIKCALVFCVRENCEQGREIKSELSKLRGIADIETERLFSLCSSGEKSLQADEMYIVCDTDSKNRIRETVDRLALRERKSETQFLEELSRDAEKLGESLLYLLNGKTVHRGRAMKLKRAEVFLPVLSALLLCSVIKNGFVFLPAALSLWAAVRCFVLRRLYEAEPARVLPKVDVQGSLPEEAATIITVSSILPDESELPIVKNHLRELFLTCRDDPVRVCLLSDLKNSNRPSQPEDKVKAENAERMIAELNREYPGRFMLFIRKRVYVRTQGDFSGRERKRGSLEDFVEYITSDNRKALEDKYLKHCGAVEGLEKFPYILALDCDTSLCRDSLRELAATALHPLNKAKVSKLNECVYEGYGIFMPQIKTKLDSAYATLFSRIMAGTGGSSIYELHGRDRYFDLFALASFTGKGLIDVKAFKRVLSGRFCEERVLSHDILEGELLGTALVVDSQVTDNFPSGEGSYFSRLHRWVRGDVQNLAFLRDKAPFENGRLNPMDKISRLKLAENLFRALLPVGSLAGLLMSCFMRPTAGLLTVLVCLVGYTAEELYSVIRLLFSPSFFKIGLRYFGDALPNAALTAVTVLYKLILLPKTALVCLDAVIRAVWRSLISKRKLLEWVTAAQAEKSKGSLLFNQLNLFTLLCSAVLFLSPSVYGIAAALFLLTGVFSDLVTHTATRRKEKKLSDGDREYLRAEAYKMWRYYERCCTEENNFLPSDNIQFAPVYREALRTSPSNIGLMLVSALCARDLSFIDTDRLVGLVEGVLCSVEKLEKYRGNLYNWYDTRTLSPLSPKFVSLVDSGNFLCSLVTLRKGLEEYQSESEKIAGLIKRIKKTEESCELSFMYNGTRNLFHIGFNADEGRLSPSYYDMLMSESRMTVYYATATGQIPTKCWGSLSRTMTVNDVFFGPASWGGTMFEYFMPQLFLPAAKNTLFSEALKYCLYSQKKAAFIRRIPYGISESGYYIFDANMNYQYKAHGVNRLKIDSRRPDEAVVSPYSTFLTLCLSPSSAIKNLKRLEEYDSKGEYGFYEALDFSEKRCFPKKYQSVKSFMAHHIGMSIISIGNLLNGRIMQRRFMSDDAMLSCSSLLNEQIPRDTALIKSDSFELRRVRKSKTHAPASTERVKRLLPESAVLSNGECTTVISDNGAGFFCFSRNTLTAQSQDLVIRPSGIFAFLGLDGKRYSLQAVTDRKNKGKYYARFLSDRVSLFAKHRSFESETRVFIDEKLSCERRRVRIKNKTEHKADAWLYFYLEPFPGEIGRQPSHRAFSKLFVTAEKLEKERLVIIKFNRRAPLKREVYCVVGFTDESDFDVCLSREKALLCKNGVFSLAENDSFTPYGFCDGDGCVYLRKRLSVKAFSSFESELFIMADTDRQSLLDRASVLRREGSCRKHASALVKGDSQTSSLLSSLLYRTETSRAIAEGVDRRVLWRHGISGDNKIAVTDLRQGVKKEELLYLAGVNRRLAGAGLTFDLIVLCGGDSVPYVRKLLSGVMPGDVLDKSGGAFVLDADRLSTDELNYILSVSVYTAGGRQALSVDSGDSPAELITVCNTSGKNEMTNERFIIKSKPRIPWCYCISNRSFGTLLSDKSLGFSFAENSYLNKISYWSNDTAYDNTETLYLKVGNKLYDLIALSTVSFGEETAIYTAKVQGISFTVRVGVAEKGAKKTVEVVCENSGNEVSGELYYYMEPLLSDSEAHASNIRFEIRGSSLVLNNAENLEYPGYAAMSCEGEEPLVATVKSAFFGGGAQSLSGCVNGCAAVGRALNLKSGEKSRTVFSLCFARTLKALDVLVSTSLTKRKIKGKITVNTGIESFDSFINGFLPNQIIDARLNMRSGFYQCSGAYGFRDQLQDSLALVLLYPERVRQQIFRHAAVQFKDGDVLHWWHSFPDRRRGIRSRYSDDAMWLVYACSEYVLETEDKEILFKQIAFLDGEPLSEGESERYGEFRYSGEKVSLLEHLFRACRHSLKTGEHGLILMQGGDWNDGMNLVGIRGKGESVWLTQFAVLTLSRFSEMLEKIGMHDKAYGFDKLRDSLLFSLEKYAYDGDRYLRAFKDNGEALGSRKSSHCSMDLLTQSFACLCTDTVSDRARTALESAERELVDRKHGIIKLLTPAFSTEDSDIGYISLYPPGIRENGGQYTHAAVWFVKALIKSGQTDRAFELLEMLNPLKKFCDSDRVYTAEPYYLCGDVMAAKGSEGRGNWSIYTGAAGWFYTVALCDLLGLSKKDGKYFSDAELPDKIKKCEITVETEDGAQSIILGSKKADKEDGEKN